MYRKSMMLFISYKTRLLLVVNVSRLFSNTNVISMIFNCSGCWMFNNMNWSRMLYSGNMRLVDNVLISTIWPRSIFSSQTSIPLVFRSVKNLSSRRIMNRGSINSLIIDPDSRSRAMLNHTFRWRASSNHLLHLRMQELRLRGVSIVNMHLRSLFINYSFLLNWHSVDLLMLGLTWRKWWLLCMMVVMRRRCHKSVNMLVHIFLNGCMLCWHSLRNMRYLNRLLLRSLRSKFLLIIMYRLVLMFRSQRFWFRLVIVCNINRSWCLRRRSLFSSI